MKAFKEAIMNADESTNILNEGRALRHHPRFIFPGEYFHMDEKDTANGKPHQHVCTRGQQYQFVEGQY